MALQEQYYCSTLDSMFPPVFQNWVLCFPCDTDNVQVVTDTLRAGLHRTVQQRPSLGGTLSREDTPPRAGRLKLTYLNDQNVEVRLSVNDLTNKPDVWGTSYGNLRQRGMPICELKPEVLAPPGGYESLASSLIVAQANFIPGGCLLDICLNHSFVDGLGGAMAVGLWAQNCKDIQMGKSSVTTSSPDDIHLPIGDLEALHMPAPDSACRITSTPLKLPDILQDSTAPRGEEVARLQEDGTLWQLLGLQKPPVDLSAAQKPSPHRAMVSGIFVASSDSVASLKRESTPSHNEGDQVSAKAFVSSFDAIATLLWKCIIKARSPDLLKRDTLRSRLRIPVNLRQTLGIPHDYPGNVLLNSVTEISLNHLITESTKRQIAPKIRSSLVSSRDAGRALDAIKLSFVLPDMPHRLPFFRDTTQEDLVLTSWRDLSYNKHDWGPMFGSPGHIEFFRLPHGSLRGVAALAPKRRDNDEFEVIINLEQGQMDRLKNDLEFTNYFKLKAL